MAILLREVGIGKPKQEKPSVWRLRKGEKKGILVESGPDEENNESKNTGKQSV
jgi:hypothetical protein